MSADLHSEYMGLKLRTPLVVSACPLSREIATVRKLEEAGAGAIVLFSLFEEQLKPGPLNPGWGAEHDQVDPAGFLTRPHAYLEHIRRLKDAVDIPIIGSLNVSAAGNWLDYAASIEHAGADALELDIYRVIADPAIPGSSVEDTYLDIFRRVRSAVSIPVAVKLTPYFTNLAAVAGRFDDAGANALVLFNRFYQPTIDVERRKLVLSLDLSRPEDSRLPVMWIAILKGQIRCDLAATTGMHGVNEVLRALLAGADVAMLCSVLLRHGPDRMADIHRLLVAWLDTHGYASVDDVRGTMRLAAQTDPDDFKRGGYAKVLARYWLDSLGLKNGRRLNAGGPPYDRRMVPPTARSQGCPKALIASRRAARPRVPVRRTPPPRRIRR